MRRLCDRSLELVADKDQSQPNYALLRETRDFLDFIDEEVPGLMDRWAARTAQRQKSGQTDDSTPDPGGLT